MTMRTAYLAAALPLAALSACATVASDAPPPAAAAAAIKFDLGPPYIGGGLPGGERLVPAPPAEGSQSLMRDEAHNAAHLETAAGPRWQQAARDAYLGPGWTGQSFDCAAGRTINDTATPATARLLRRAGGDFAMSTSAVKERYMRLRPFAVNGGPTCTPDDEQALRGNGSYPSGHAAIGYGTGLLLASLLPERAADLLARGKAFAASRAICNVHWTSDVEAGETIAAAAFARLQADEAFRTDWAAARAELAAVSAQPVDAVRCEQEQAALARR